jgi:hypothetical protein
MTTPSKAERPIVHVWEGKKYYFLSSADALFESLEQENARLDAFCREFVWGEGESASQMISRLEAELARLQVELGDTKRALKLSLEGGQPFASDLMRQDLIDKYLERARKERAALPDAPTVAEEGK